MSHFPVRSLVLTLLAALAFACSSPVAETVLSTESSQEGRGFTGASTYASLYFRGTPNAWSTQAMNLVADYTWQTEATFQASGRFKFDVNGNWSLNFGNNNADLIADQNGGDIQVPSAGTYVIRFNDQTRAYSVTLKVLEIQTDIYAVPDRSVIVSDWEIAGLTVNIYTQDQTLLRSSPIWVTSSHGTYASLRSPGINPGTYTAQVNELKDNYRYTGESTFTLVNSASFSPTITITKTFEGGSADIYWDLQGSYAGGLTVINGLSAQVFKNSQLVLTTSIQPEDHQQPWTPLSGLSSGDYQISVNEVKNAVRYQGTGFFTISETAPRANFSISVTGTPTDFKKSYSQFFLRGTFNSWGTTPMTLVADNTWRAQVSFAPGTTKAFKFDAFGNWAVNFGDNNNDGVADQNGANISVQTAMNVTITFNDVTQVYSLAGY